MKITEININESHIDEVYKLTQKGKEVIALGLEEVKIVLTGKEGILYEAYQDKCVDNRTFMKEFFVALKKKEVHNYTYLLFNIVMSHDKGLLMDELDILRDFLKYCEEKNIIIDWGLRQYEEGNQMSILAACTINV